MFWTLRHFAKSIRTQARAVTSLSSNALSAQLESEGVTVVLGTIVNPAGLTHVKTVPVRRTHVFIDPGLGASPSWHGFTIDRTGIAFTDNISVVGDERIRIDPVALRSIGEGLAWAPGAFFDQNGNPVSSCSRGALGRIEILLQKAGLRALVGHEIEFLLVDPTGNQLPGNYWTQYGLAGVLEHEGFIRDVISAASAAGIEIEQFHPEYGLNQFEISLAPKSPVAAADQLILARIIISRVARKYGMRISLSPKPFKDGAGSGAHQHFSLMRGDTPLFSGGTGVQGLTSEGEASIAGIVSGLLEAQLILCGSIVSGMRMLPGKWAGAYACWGTENREAAVRFLRASHGNLYGANVEVKIVDPSANPYFATAAILGLALDGIERHASLSPEITRNPATLTESERKSTGTLSLPTNQADMIAALSDSRKMRTILGDPAVEAVLAVRRYEHLTYAHFDAEQLIDKFRMAWSL